MSLLKDLPELLEADIISPETADRIREYYRNKGGSSTGRLFVAFGILGAILIGLGIILIVAHNWDQLSRATKTLLAFLPLGGGQLLCGFVLLKRRHRTAWRESAAALLFFAVGASLALVSQIYQIPGDIGSFLLTWMLLVFPLIYVMSSSITSLLYLVGITYYAVQLSYWSFPSADSSPYWPMLLGALPHYFGLLKNKPLGNFTIFHHWVVPLSVMITLGTVARNAEELMFIAYFSLFGLFYSLGRLDFFRRQRARNSGYQFLGSLGTIVLLLALSFGEFWKELRSETFPFEAILSAPEFYASLILSLLAAGLLYFRYRSASWQDIEPLALIFMAFIPTFVLGQYLAVAVVLINLYGLAIGIHTVRQGARQDHLGVLNYGLLIITALVVCRFFDTDLSFVLRGMLFVCVGVGFFGVNYWTLKKRKTYEQP